MLDVRSATIADAYIINEMALSLAYEPVSLDIAEQRLDRLLNSSLDSVYVAQLDNQVVGWLHCFYANRLASDSFYEIAGLVVSARARRQGAGRALVEFAMLQQPGVWRVRCNEQRFQAHEFYQNLDFEKVKQQCVFTKHSLSTK
jgi:N-acetylglutamate synthase-like GNAT family acetyltransferase